MRLLNILFLLFVSLSAKEVNLNEIFQPTVKYKNGQVEVNIKIKEGNYLSKDLFKFEVEPSSLVEIGKFTLKEGEKDEFGDEVYSGFFNAKIPILLKGDAEEFTFVLSYQGCSKEGVCYPPITKKYDLNLSSKSSAVWNPTGMVKIESGSQVEREEQKWFKKDISEEQSIALVIESKSFGIVLLTFFGFGLLLALTPCIFPMIPILSSMIVSQGEGLTAKKGFMLSLVYVLSMALTYSIAGVLAGLFGANIQAAMQNPFVIIIFSLVFVVLALSMFGLFKLQLPHSIQTKISRKSDDMGKKGGVLGVGIMGFLSALIVGPCVAPPLAGALVYIGQTGDALLGGAALFVMSLGMGLPLLLIGAGAGRFMPRPGSWMELVSKFFGFVMLGLAIWMLSRVLPNWITMVMWSSLAVIGSIYLGALEPLVDKRGIKAFFKGVGILLLMYGLFLLFGAFSGATTPLDPLKSFKGVQDLKAYDIKSHELRFENADSLEELFVMIESSGSTPVMVEFTAKWCASCKELEDKTFKDIEVIETLTGFRLIKVDVTQNSEQQKKIMRQFNVFGPPSILFFVDGKELKSKRITGYKSPNEFLKVLKEVLDYGY